MWRLWCGVAVVLAAACLLAVPASAQAAAVEGQAITSDIGQFGWICGGIGEEILCGGNPTVTVDFGDGTSDNAPTITDLQQCGGEAVSTSCYVDITDSHTYAEEGTYTTTVTWSITVPEPYGTWTESGAFTGAITVSDTPLLAGSAPPMTGTAGTPASTSATFTDTNPASDPTDLSATIDWGDGMTSAGTLSGAGPSYTVTATHAYAAPGIYAITITSADAGGSTVTMDSTARISAAPAPVTAITAWPTSPDGAAGWYRRPVHVTAAGSESGGPVAQTRCALDPGLAPLGFSDLPPTCPFTGLGANVTGDGTHQLYSASVDASGVQEAPELTTIRIDTTPPVLACPAVPTFRLGSSGASLIATVRDVTSGPAVATASAPSPLDAPGMHSVALTGYDVAGNTTTVRCPYRVLGQLHSSLRWRFAARRRYSTALHLVARGLPPGSTVTVACRRARTCPFRARSLRPHTAAADLTPVFGSRRLPVGTQIVITISKPFYISTVIALTIRGDRQPLATVTAR